ncbi:hypothetical protein [Dokdonella sp.]|uniref:hypothetical protein n=1 Tax=Dokdonella sp. TaxID=2291710 RepID=UPI0025BFBF3D|nr:hypothetical protein [Dokdonella sp.]MBX3692117.1 hypothetical protein [Dokdonella sp.]MCW5567988.1 hypothetical protein [Dokdonella sp.]
MIPDKLKARMKKDREMTSITLRIPVDVVESLKAIAPHKGMSGYQALLKAYVSEGLRRDEAVHVFGPAARLAQALRKRGVPAELIEAAVQEAAA